MKAALCARVSTERQAERGTIGSQVDALRAHVAAAGDDPAAEYRDDGHSGARLDRPGLDALQLLRLLIDNVQVTGWHVKIQLHIALPGPPGNGRPGTDPPQPDPADGTTPPVSTGDGLRSLHGHRRRVVPHATGPNPGRWTNQTINPEGWRLLIGHQWRHGLGR